MPQLEYDKYYHIYNRGNNRADLFTDNADYEIFLNLFDKYIYPIANIYAWVLMKNHFHLLVRVKAPDEIGFYLPLNDTSKDHNRFQTTMHHNNLTESERPVRVVDIHPPNNLTESERPVRVVDIHPPNNLTESEGPVRVVDNPTSNNLTESEGPVRVDNRSNPYSTNSDRSNDSVRLKIPNPSRHFSHLFNSYSRYYNPKYIRTGALFERPFERVEVNSIEYLKRLIIYIHTNPVHHGFTDDFTSYPKSSYHSLISSENTKLMRDEIMYWFNDIENFKTMHQMKIDTELISDILLE